jgi:virginiamycin B lyase
MERARNGRHAGRIATAIGSAIFVVLAGGPASATTRIHEVAVPTSGAGPFGIARGPAGTVWFTESYADAIAVVQKDGTISEFALPAGSEPEEIAAGPDGNMWFAAYGANAIGRIKPSGGVRLFAIPTPASGPFGIASGPDGNLWFTESSANTIGRITPRGTITEFHLDPGFTVEGITAGPDGAMWFTRFSNPQFPYPGFIGRITTAGSWTEVPSYGVGDPLGIVTGSDGNLWVTGPSNDVVARVGTDFSITPYRVPGGLLNVPYLIAAGTDGALWFTQNGVSEAPDNVGGNKIGRITTDGRIRQFQVPTPSSEPSGITVGPRGTVWFTEQTGNNLGRIRLGP